jgi:diadenosine tetraphosphate (Ap4A) HIT family hydrolase
LFSSSVVSLPQDLAIKYGYHDEGFRLVINDGPAGFQRIPHLAIHVLAGEENSYIEMKRSEKQTANQGWDSTVA